MSLQHSKPVWAFLWIALLGLFVPLAPSAAGLSLPEAINKAGRQRMLSQRIVKSYVQIGQQIQYRASKQQLADAIALFDAQLAELQQFEHLGGARANLDEIATLWEPVKSIASAKVDRDQAETLRAQAEQLLAASHRFVLLLEKSSGTSQGKLVNIAGRQRMLSQRMANLYGLRSWGFENPEFLEDYQKAVSDFSSALELLQAAPENTPEINAGLTAVGKQWYMFVISSGMDKGKYIPNLISRSADKILKLMNEITGLYSALPAG